MPGPMITATPIAPVAVSSWRKRIAGPHSPNNAVHYFDVSVHQIHAAAAGSGSSPAESNTPLPPVLEVEELTVLTGWAQAVSETLAVAPKRLTDLLAAAHLGAPWRTEFNVVEPSARLDEAVDIIERIVATCSRSDGPPTFDALLAATTEDRPGESALDGLVRRVLRSTLEQGRSRNAATAARP